MDLTAPALAVEHLYEAASEARINRLLKMSI